MQSNHQKQWKQIQDSWLQGKMMQSMLLVGPLHYSLSDFALKMNQLFLCKMSKESGKSCKQCQDCLLVVQMTHPDVEWIKPETIDSAIKIDQIRNLQQAVYLTPRQAASRIIIIESADKMNLAAANALLKILEEPPAHVIFILIAEQLSTIIPTILSRCGLIRFSSSNVVNWHNLLDLGKHYPEASERALMVSQAKTILDDLIALMECIEHPCAIATKWTQYEFYTLLWFLYLVFAQLQIMKFIGETKVCTSQLIKLSAILDSVAIFSCLDTLSHFIKKMHHHLNFNQGLALEHLFFSLIYRNKDF